MLLVSGSELTLWSERSDFLGPSTLRRSTAHASGFRAMCDLASERTLIELELIYVGPLVVSFVEKTYAVDEIVGSVSC